MQRLGHDHRTSVQSFRTQQEPGCTGLAALQGRAQTLPVANVLPVRNQVGPGPSQRDLKWIRPNDQEDPAASTAPGARKTKKGTTGEKHGTPPRQTGLDDLDDQHARQEEQ